MVTWNFVDEDQGVVGEIFEQGRGRLAGAAAGEVAGVVLDAGAGAGGFHHLEIEQGALFEALGLEEAAGAVELLEARGELGLDALDGAGHGGARGHVVAVGEDADREEVGVLLAGERIELGDRLDLVAEQGDAPGGVLVVGGEELDGVAADAEGAADEAGVAALVLELGEGAEELALVDLLALAEVDGHRGVVLDRADAVDAGDRGDDDDVVALEQGARGRSGACGRSAR